MLPKLSPIQAGVGVRDATTHVALGAAHFLPAVAARKGLGFLQFDLVNAFNSVSRDAILRQEQKGTPYCLGSKIRHPIQKPKLCSILRRLSLD